MIVQTTTNFDNSLDAQDTLAGLKDRPGFCFGYITITEKHTQQFQVVTLFRCQGTEPQPTQKKVMQIRSNPGGIREARAIADGTSVSWNHERAGLE